MTSKDFVNWLSGYFDALGELTPSPSDIKNIREKISEVKNSEKEEYFPLHRIPTTPYNPPSTSPDWGTWITPYGGTTINYDYRTTESGDETNKVSDVDKEHNSEN
jgi:hypothetical protein